jgi:hypothetical protein
VECDALIINGLLSNDLDAGGVVPNEKKRPKK